MVKANFFFMNTSHLGKIKIVVRAQIYCGWLGKQYLNFLQFVAILTIFLVLRLAKATLEKA